MQKIHLYKIFRAETSVWCSRPGLLGNLTSEEWINISAPLLPISNYHFKASYYYKEFDWKVNIHSCSNIDDNCTLSIYVSSDASTPTPEVPECVIDWMVNSILHGDPSTFRIKMFPANLTIYLYTLSWSSWLAHEFNSW